MQSSHVNSLSCASCFVNLAHLMWYHWVHCAHCTHQVRLLALFMTHLSGGHCSFTDELFFLDAFLSFVVFSDWLISSAVFSDAFLSLVVFADEFSPLVVFGAAFVIGWIKASAWTSVDTSTPAPRLGVEDNTGECWSSVKGTRLGGCLTLLTDAIMKTIFGKFRKCYS